MRAREPKRQAHRRGLLRHALGVLAVGLVLLNVVAALQVRAMTHFVRGAPPLTQLTELPAPQLLWALVSGVPVPRPANLTTPADHYLPYEVRSLPLVEGEQLEAWHVPHPRPRGLVLMFSGFAGVKEGLLTPAAHLHRFGYSCLLVDFRGSGGSSRDDTTVGMREAEDVAAAFGYAAGAWPGLPLIGYGVSMGSAALMRAVALHGVTPAGLILETPFDRLLTTVRHRFDALGLPGSPGAELLVFWGSVQLGYNGFAHNPVAYAPHVACPALLMRGERDPWVSGEELASIAGALGGPQRVVTVPGAAHEMPFVYGAPDLWQSEVQRFLDDL